MGGARSLQSTWLPDYQLPQPQGMMTNPDTTEVYAAWADMMMELDACPDLPVPARRALQVALGSYPWLREAVEEAFERRSPGQ